MQLVPQSTKCIHCGKAPVETLSLGDDIVGYAVACCSKMIEMAYNELAAKTDGINTPLAECGSR